MSLCLRTLFFWIFADSLLKKWGGTELVRPFKLEIDVPELGQQGVQGPIRRITEKATKGAKSMS
jgi:hypothetical protein